jgi:hypothetical protein
MTTKTTPMLANNTKGSLAVTATVEQLEARQLLSVSMHEGVVVVECTPGQDSVQVFSTDAGVEQTLVVEIWSGDHGTCANFRLADVSAVQVNDMGADDELLVDESYGASLAIPVTRVDGGGEDSEAASVDNNAVDGATGQSDDETKGMMGSAADDEVAPSAAPAMETVFGDKAADGEGEVWAM